MVGSDLFMVVAQLGRMKGAMRAEWSAFSLSSALLSRLGYPSQLCHYPLRNVGYMLR
jgi:hypothetical protein